MEFFVSTLIMRNVSKQFQDYTSIVPILNNASYTFESNCTYALMGASGSGKSTIMHMLSGIESVTSGAILFDGQDIATFSENTRSHFFSDTLGLVFQASCLFDEFTIEENVCIKAMLTGRMSQEVRLQAGKLLEQVGLLEKKDYYPAQLSGGQQQRVALLRALLFPPKFLFLDEPTGNLDAHLAQEMMQLILQYQKEYKMGIIMSTHDEKIAAYMEKIIMVHNYGLQEKA